ncbi:hypothetical protein AYI68_g2043 [Smittium mucronatum]|nr:hypothetical protein AYI68_g2043 [Smittium mucronatum]
MHILLYQSELVRIENSPIHPERIKAAKIECLKVSSEISNLFDWKIKNVPRPYWCQNLTPWLTSCLSILINSCFILQDGQTEPTNQTYELLVKNYFESSKNCILGSFLGIYIKNLYDLKRIAFLKYCNNISALSLMLPYCSAPNDYYPWIVPKYSSYAKFLCCFSSNHTSIDINEYLFIASPHSSEDTKLDEPIGNPLP